MKYLEILKEYDKQIVSESKKLDGIYKKLLGEECTCGQPDCPECGNKDEDDGIKKENLESKCCEDGKKDGDTRVGFDESCVGEETAEGAEGNKDDKMVDKDTFLKGLSNDSGDSDKDGAASADDDVVSGDEENGGSDEIKKKLQEFFGDSDKETTAESAEETVRKNQEEMSAKGVDGEQGEDTGDNGDSASSEETTGGDSDSGSSDDTESEKKPDSQENTENVTNECGNGKTIKELMEDNAKGDVDDGEKQTDETPPPDETTPPPDETEEKEELEEEMRLNESIQAIKKFVKANKKYFK